MLERPSWFDGAACRDTDTDLFYADPPRGANPAHDPATIAALGVCARCPVRGECLAHAIEHREQGVWGGTTDSQRQRLRDNGAPTVDRRWKAITHGTVTGYQRGCRLECCRAAHRISKRERAARQRGDIDPIGERHEGEAS